MLLSCSEKKIYPDRYLSKSQQDEFKYMIVRYVAKIPDTLKGKNLWDSAYDDLFYQLKDNINLQFYYKDEKGYEFFSVTRIAPSMEYKLVATVGRLKRDKNNNIESYKEIYRTWKMPPDELNKKNKMLFLKAINGEDLSPYYTKNSHPEFYIEFPDDHNFYDTIQRKWIFKP